MHSVLTYLQDHTVYILFNVAAILIFFLIARLLNARQPIAFAFAFMPVLVGWAFTNPAAKVALSGLF